MVAVSKVANPSNCARKLNNDPCSPWAMEISVMPKNNAQAFRIAAPISPRYPDKVQGKFDFPLSWPMHFAKKNRVKRLQKSKKLSAKL